MNSWINSQADPPASLAIHLSQVRFAYGGSQHPVLAIEDWRVERQASVFIYGPSGGGKTTLLNLVGGRLVPDAGRVEVLGEPVGTWRGARRDRFRAQHIGMIFQQFNLIPWLSVRDNIALAHHLARRELGRAALNKRMLMLLDAMRIPRALMDRRAVALSVGQQQRVAIARALVNEPELIVADEPTSAMDMQVRDDFLELLTEFVDAFGATLLFVSHDRELARFFDRVVDLQSVNRAAETSEARACY